MNESVSTHVFDSYEGLVPGMLQYNRYKIRNYDILPSSVGGRDQNVMIGYIGTILITSLKI